MERIFFLPSYVYMEMQGRREIYEEGENSRRDETEESLIYISVFQRGEEKVLFAKVKASLPLIIIGQEPQQYSFYTVVGYCPHCHRKTSLQGRSDIYYCLACGAVCREREIVRESTRRWWL